PGHVLIAPQDHYSSFLHYTRDGRADFNLRTISSLLGYDRRSYLVIENGSGARLTFCGVSHAHTHIIPTAVSEGEWSFIEAQFRARVSGECMLTRWWPNDHVLTNGAWNGYVFVWAPTLQRVITLYLRQRQSKQLSRLIIAAAM